MAINNLLLAESFFWLDGMPISYEKRPYLEKIYNNSAERIVLRCSRQVEKTTTLSILIILKALLDPGSSTLVVFPREEQLRVFRDTKLMPLLRESPGISKVLLGPSYQKSARQIIFSNKSQIHLRSAFNSADAARGISASLLVMDEFQDMAPDALPVTEQALAHADKKRIILAGTPKMADNPLEEAFNYSQQHIWKTSCPKCETENIPEELCMGSKGPVCINCGEDIDFSKGYWTTIDSAANWGMGFWINHLMVPWVNYQEILTYRQTYDNARFKNEVLGLPTMLGDHIVTEEQLLACCTETRMEDMSKLISSGKILKETIAAGIDWSGGSKTRTALCIGGLDRSGSFYVLHLEVFPPHEDQEILLKEIEQICNRYSIKTIAADGNGNGTVFNRNLVSRKSNKLTKINGIFYSSTSGEPREVSTSENHWTLSKSIAIGDVFTRIMKNKIFFPCREDIEDEIRDIFSETVNYDAENRSVRYFVEPGKTDDALHALTYSLALSSRTWGSL